MQATLPSETRFREASLCFANQWFAAMNKEGIPLGFPTLVNAAQVQNGILQPFLIG
jgi:hypothetical protein